MQRTCGTSSVAVESRLVDASVGDVPPGFLSPAQYYSAPQIDLTRLLNKDELSTFIVRVTGDSMPCGFADIPADSVGFCCVTNISTCGECTCNPQKNVSLTRRVSSLGAVLGICDEQQ